MRLSWTSLVGKSGALGRAIKAPFILIPSLILGLCALLVSGMLTASAGPAGISGAGTTGVIVYNLGDQPSDIDLDFYPQNDSAPIRINRPDVPPGTGAHVYLPSESRLANGAYSVVAAGQNIRMFARHDWMQSGASFMQLSPTASQELIMPLIAKDAFGQRSILNIQNADLNAENTIEVQLMEEGAITPLISWQHTIGPGRSVSLDFGRAAQFDELPEGFQGWANISAEYPVVASSVHDVSTSDLAVFDIEALPEEDLSRHLSVPAVYHEWIDGDLTSGIFVRNPGAEASEVAISYTGVAGSCLGKDYSHEIATVPAGGSITFYQGNVASMPGGSSHLPENCIAAAELEASEPILATVILSKDQESGAAYAAQSRGDTDLHLPVVREAHLGLTTDLVVQAVGEQATQATLVLMSADGRPIDCGAPCVLSLATGAAYLDLSDVSEFNPGTYGTAKITADGPIVAAVVEQHAETSIDLGAYLGLGMRQAGYSSDEFLPISFKMIGGPVRPTNPAPGETPQPTTPPGRPSPTREAPPEPRDLFAIHGVSGIQLVNLDNVALKIEAMFAEIGSEADPVQITRSGVAPGESASIYVPSERQLGMASYSMLGLAASRAGDEEIGLLARTDWNTSGAAILYGALEQSESLILPGIHVSEDDWRSVIGVQNLDEEEEAQVSIEFMQDGDSMTSKQVSLDLGPGRSAVINPQTHPAFTDADGEVIPMTGWMRLDSDRPISALAVRSDAYAQGADSLDAFSAADLDANQVAPLVMRQVPIALEDPSIGSLSTAISVLNAGTETMEFQVRYRGAQGSNNNAACQNLDRQHPGGPFTLEPGESTVLDQDATGPGPASGLPKNCAVSASIESMGGGLVAWVQIRNTSGRHMATYRAAPAVQAVMPGSLTTELPLVRREHIQSFKLSTAIQIMNLGTQSAEVELDLQMTGGDAADCDNCQVTLEPGKGYLWRPEDLPEAYSGRYGLAHLSSNQALEVVVLDMSQTEKIDMAAYSGFNAQGVPNPNAPLVLGGSMRDIPAPDLLEGLGRPEVSLPLEMPVLNDDRLSIPLQFDSAGHDIGRMHIDLDYAESWLHFNEEDENADGIPDGLVSNLPAEVSIQVHHRPEQADSELSIIIDASNLPGMSWPEELFDLQLEREAGELADDAWLGFSSDRSPQVWDRNGQSSRPALRGGYVPARPKSLYLPQLFADQ